MSYNKVLLKYCLPYYMVTALLLGGGTYAIILTLPQQTTKHFEVQDYCLLAFISILLLWVLYFYTIDIPIQTRKRLNKVAEKYLQYSSTKFPEMANIKEIIKNKEMFNNFANAVFNTTTKQDRDEIINLIKQFDLKSSQSDYEEKALIKELEDKIFEIIQKRSLTDINYNQTILNNMTYYSSTRNGR
ncbi:MAG: hypothetical protein IKZ49_02905 [Alphaproteobacteria bacterium]|nr:hypothetical protein [Alphaproteobacteria bacterium]